MADIHRMLHTCCGGYPGSGHEHKIIPPHPLHEGGEASCKFHQYMWKVVNSHRWLFRWMVVIWLVQDFPDGPSRKKKPWQCFYLLLAANNVLWPTLWSTSQCISHGIRTIAMLQCLQPFPLWTTFTWSTVVWSVWNSSPATWMFYQSDPSVEIIWSSDLPTPSSPLSLLGHIFGALRIAGRSTSQWVIVVRCIEPFTP